MSDSGSLTIICTVIYRIKASVAESEVSIYSYIPPRYFGSLIVSTCLNNIFLLRQSLKNVHVVTLGLSRVTWCTQKQIICPDDNSCKNNLWYVHSLHKMIKTNTPSHVCIFYSIKQTTANSNIIFASSDWCIYKCISKPYQLEMFGTYSKRR